jgi:signal transduction histidine kinase
MDEETFLRARILIVDDEITSVRLLEDVLKLQGFTNVRKLTDSTTFFAAFGDWDPDLIITDLEMPNLGGIELVEGVRAVLPTDACLPILVITGSQNIQAKRSALAAGATEILFKPFDSPELLMRIRNLLRTRFQHLEIKSQNQMLEKTVMERTSELRRALAELEASQRQVVQRERLRAFGEMAGGVVHDFNNSLMSIIGYSELLLQNSALLEDPKVIREYMEVINVAGRDAAHVTSRLRDFYRPREESDMFAVVDINQLLEAVQRLTKPKWHNQALEKGLAIRFELDLQQAPLAYGNGAALREVLTNLVFNAVDAMPQGGTITLRSAERDGSAVVEVQDTGTGMSEEVCRRCLEPFFTTKAEQGTGLGLAMVFGIVRRHEGTLDIESALGRGTTVRLTLPSCQPAISDHSETRLTLDRSLRVLVVDDEPLSLNVVSQYLFSDRHRVATASCGREAMQKAMSEDFDLFIIDIGMPGMNGVQVADVLHRMNADKPIILLTGFGVGPEQRPMFVRSLLKKPLVPTALRSALQEAFGRQA